MATNGLQAGIANLVAGLTGGDAIQQRARNAEELRLIQAQDARAALDKRISDAVQAAQAVKARTEFLNANPGNIGNASIGGFGSDYKAATEATGVGQQNDARAIAAQVAAGMTDPYDRFNANIGVAGDKMLTPSNVGLDDQLAGIIELAATGALENRAQAGAANASAGASNARAALDTAKLPFVGAGAQATADLNAAKLRNEELKYETGVAKRDAGAQKENRLLDSFRSKRDLVAKQVKAAKDQSGFFSLGAGAETAAKYGPGGFLNQPRQLQEKINGIMSAIGLDSIMELKNASANGSTGFGALTAPELKLLQDRYGSLSLARTEEEFDATLDELLSAYDRLLGAMESDLSTSRGGSATPAATAPAAADDYQEGEILTNAEGARIILRNGQWVPL